MSEPVVTIKPICTTDWLPLRTEVFIDYQGHRFHSRLAYYVTDSAHQRAYFAQEFLRRLKIHPSITQQKEKPNGILDRRDHGGSNHRRDRLAEAQPAQAGHSAGGPGADANRPDEVNGDGRGHDHRVLAFTLGPDRVDPAVERTQALVEQALNSDILEFAKTGEPPKRPTLTVV